MPVIAERWNYNQLIPQVCFHSTAIRATSTAEGICAGLNQSVPTEPRKELYTFDGNAFFQFIIGISEAYDNVAIVAHNPGLTDLINFLGNVRLDNLPTGGYCQYKFDVNRWEDIGEDTGEVVHIEFPKQFK